MQTLTGLIRINKSYGVIPSARGSSRPGSPCGQFYVAILDPDNGNKPLNTTTTDARKETDEFYTCRYSLSGPKNKRLYAIAGMGGTGGTTKSPSSNSASLPSPRMMMTWRSW